MTLSFSSSKCLLNAKSLEYSVLTNLVFSNRNYMFLYLHSVRSFFPFNFSSPSSFQLVDYVQFWFCQLEGVTLHAGR